MGFTSGTPYESPQPDSLTTSVEAQDPDPGSMLNLYRRLIHLRRENEALATGRLVPLSTSSSQVAAYLRRAGDHAALVVANLGAAAASGVSISSEKGVLPPGRYTPRGPLGGPNGVMLQVGRDGRIRDYIPVPGTIGPKDARVFDLLRP